MKNVIWAWGCCKRCYYRSFQMSTPIARKEMRKLGWKMFKQTLSLTKVEFIKWFLNIK